MNEFSSLSDDKLVQLYVSGDSSAFETLVSRHKDKVYGYIYNIVKDDNVADDIFQETFIKIIITLKQKRYTNDGKFVSWVMRIAHNQTIDYYRRIATSKIIVDDESVANNANIMDDSDIEVQMYEQLLQRVGALMDFLPEEQRRVVEMRYYKNLSFNEISQIEHISINTALGRMRYAVINLRKIAKRQDIIEKLYSSVVY